MKHDCFYYKLDDNLTHKDRLGRFYITSNVRDFIYKQASVSLEPSRV